MYSFEVHSNERACRKSGRLGLEQVTIKNIRGIPLAYILCNTPSPSSIIIDMKQYIIQNSPLYGNIFSRDTKKVLAIIKELTVYTDVETWMKAERCG